MAIREKNPNVNTNVNNNLFYTSKLSEYMEKEVLPHVPDAWIDHSKTNVGYEINFTKYFYQYKPLRSLDEIRADIMALEQETDGLLKNVIG
jgi:type I restriction enzyme M protein